MEFYDYILDETNIKFVSQMVRHSITDAIIMSSSLIHAAGVRVSCLFISEGSHPTWFFYFYALLKPRQIIILKS